MTAAPILSLQGIHKRFPGVCALRDVDFELRAGEVHALVGENGAGKSTLIKILAGVYDSDQGRYLIDGREAAITGPRDAMARGIGVIYQELELVPTLSVAENVFFGRLPHTRTGRVQWARLHREAAALLAQVGLAVPVGTKAGHLGIGAQQLVEIARALSLNARVMIMDEPTSALSPQEAERLFELTGRLRERGVGIIYVSHKLDEILRLSDRVTVLRDGERVGTVPAAGLGEEQLIAMMVGRRLTGGVSRQSAARAEAVLVVEGLTTGRVRNVSFTARRGEVIGFSGLMGAGRTELIRGLFGVDRRLGGQIAVAGRRLPANSPAAARRLGMGLVPEDRRRDGIFPQLSVRENMSVAALGQFSRRGRMQRGPERRGVAAMIEALGVRTPSAEQVISKLSGGNQQKVLIARWLLVENLRVLFVDEPTRGIDVGARGEIYGLLDGLARRGLAVVLMSSEMPEILRLCDRIYTMCRGQISGELTRQEATQEKLLAGALPRGQAAAAGT
ncbi:MAG: sugar ABC transporter ATP-binding protein [Gemmatimonadota bacterium]